jgi:superfamily II DNA or RNA helicase
LSAGGNTLGIAPTGAGKTVMLSAITSHYTDKGAKALVLQHRDELVDQNRATFERFNSRATTGLFTADHKSWHGDVTFSMIQTLARNIDTMPALDVLAIDEGHHAAADSYLRVIDKARKANSDLKLLLVTATPNRGDKKSLKGIVDNVADQISLKELIEARLLVKPRTFVIDIGVQNELRGVKKRAADFDMNAVEAIMDKEVLNDQVVAKWAEVAADRQTVVFCSTVAHAQHVADAFAAHGIRAACVWADMGDAARRDTLRHYDAGDIQVITNVAVLTEGWDHQPTSCVVLLRPSSYQSTMMQMIGRGLRTVDPERYPGVIKDDCIVLDFGTSILTHGSIEQECDLAAGGVKDCPECASSLPAQCRECAICGHVFPREETEASEPSLLAADSEDVGRSAIGDFILTEVDLLEDSPYRYENLWDGLVCMAAAMDAWACVLPFHGRWHGIGGTKMGGLKHLADSGDRLTAMAAADDFLRLHGDSTAAKKTKRWLSEPCTDKQREILRLDPMQAIGVTKYRAACLIQWKWSEKAIQSIVTASHRRAA